MSALERPCCFAAGAFACILGAMDIFRWIGSAGGISRHLPRWARMPATWVYHGAVTFAAGVVGWLVVFVFTLGYTLGYAPGASAGRWIAVGVYVWREYMQHRDRWDTDTFKQKLDAVMDVLFPFAVALLLDVT